MTQSSGAENTFFVVTLYNFLKSGRAIALPAPPPPRSLVAVFLCTIYFINIIRNDCNVPCTYIIL